MRVLFFRHAFHIETKKKKCVRDIILGMDCNTEEFCAEMTLWKSLKESSQMYGLV